MRAGHAWQSMGKSAGALHLMGRTEARLQRQFDSAFDRLARLRELRPDQNEQTNPIPDAASPEQVA